MPEHDIASLFDLTGRTALVTGGAGWLGTAFCDALGEAGATVITTSRNGMRAREAAQQIAAPQGQNHHGLAMNLMAAESIATGFREALSFTGRIDILVNNALDALGKDLDQVTLEEFAFHQRNNAAYFELARLVRDDAVRRGAPASIINLGSMYGQVASYPDSYEGVCAASSVAYHALRGGTIHMTRHLAVYWARDKVRVNCLSPGPFPNPKTAPAELMDRLQAKTPVQRMGQPWELKGAVVFLASDASSYVTGHNLTVDGGWTAW